MKKLLNRLIAPLAYGWVAGGFIAAIINPANAYGPISGLVCIVILYANRIINKHYI